jgi:hypothetical protein
MELGSWVTPSRYCGGQFLAIRKAGQKRLLREPRLQIREYLMNDQRDTTKPQSGTEPKKTPELSREEQELLAGLDRD